MEPDLLEEIESMIEEIDYIVENNGGWILPSGSNAVIKTNDGHLSVIHTSQLVKVVSVLRKIT